MFKENNTSHKMIRQESDKKVYIGCFFYVAITRVMTHWVNYLGGNMSAITIKVLHIHALSRKIQELISVQFGNFSCMLLRVACPSNKYGGIILLKLSATFDRRVLCKTLKVISNRECYVPKYTWASMALLRLSEIYDQLCRTFK